MRSRMVNAKYQLTSSTRGLIKLHTHPIAEPTKRCSKSRRTSWNSRLRRIHVPHQVVYVVLGLALFGGLSVFGFLSSYARMAWKVANYNALKHEADALRSRYRNLQRTVNETNVQLASLQTLASEISV